MKQHSEKDIAAFVRDLWHKPNDFYPYPEVKVHVKKDCVDLEITSMYQAPGLSLARMNAIAKFFDAKDVNDVDQIAQQGCETCDYGSKYGFTLRVQ
jgi:hypothetical protein